ncbi:hypothetical protein CGRA01v4_08352 [Colletotrichum graminicola]|nr:hypothetical protein CGRA01v4_08352 [Colletotrichum graminicola]
MTADFVVRLLLTLVCTCVLGLTSYDMSRPGRNQKLRMLMCEMRRTVFVAKSDTAAEMAGSHGPKYTPGLECVWITSLVHTKLIQGVCNPATQMRAIAYCKFGMLYPSPPRNVASRKR